MLKLCFFGLFATISVASGHNRYNETLGKTGPFSPFLKELQTFNKPQPVAGDYIQTKIYYLYFSKYDICF